MSYVKADRKRKSRKSNRSLKKRARQRSQRTNVVVSRGRHVLIGVGVYQTSMSLVDVVDCLYDHLSVGDIVRLHEAMCVRDSTSDELLHLVFARVGRVPRKNISWRLTAAQVASRLLSGTRTRCRECGVRCMRRCRVCATCACDHSSYRALVTRADLVLHVWAETGWRMSYTSMAQRVSHLQIVGRTPRGAHLYWRRDALAALA